MGNLIFNFYDVGHGSCTRITTPNGQNILVDIGSPSDDSISWYFKNKLGLDKIDMLYITHAHKDHLYDLTNLIDRGLSPKVLCRDKEAFPITHIYKGNQSDKVLQDTANDMNNKYNGEVLPYMDPTNPNNNGGVYFECLNARDKDKKINDPNSYSLLLIVKYKNWKILLTGDNNKEILKDRIETSDIFKDQIKQCDVLLAPHHGRDSDFCQEFFDIVNPSLTIVSDKNIEHDSQITTANNYNNTNKKGFIVHNTSTERKVLTTRSDGTIQLSISEEGKYTIKTGATSYGK